MDESTKHHNPNPILTSNWVSQLFFWWLNPIFKTGFKRQLNVEDLYNVTNQDSSCVLGAREWEKEVRKKEQGGQPRLIMALARMFGLKYLLFGILVFIEEGTKVVQPLLLGQLIKYFTPNSEMSRRDAYLYAMGVSLCAVVLAVAHHPYFFGVQRIGMQMRVACCSILYRKALRLSNTAMGQTTVGQIVNLMSNDVNRFDTAAVFLHYLWVGPCQAIPVLVILWYELGPSALAGFIVLVLLVPVQSYMGKLFSKLRSKTAVHTDERVKVMNEIISGMRVIKMYCWEKPFGELVNKLRHAEIQRILATTSLRGLIVGFFFLSNKVMVFLTFLIYILTGGLLTAEKVFLTISLYTSIRLSTTLFIPFAVSFAFETQVSAKRLQECKAVRRSNYLKAIHLSTFFGAFKIVIFVTFLAHWLLGDPLLSNTVFVTMAIYHGIKKSLTLFFPLSVGLFLEGRVCAGRIQTFLLLDELDNQALEAPSNGKESKSSCLVLSGVSAKWDQATELMTLKDISVEVKAGKLLAVIGPVGAGKTSLLMSILGELRASEGHVQVKGRVAYVSQQPWVFSASLRQNIIFGRPYDKKKYDRVVKACALTKDLEIMPHGDSTLIGDRGVSLSGGQRARVSLARALYIDADIYLLDDPLSAVDSAVGRHLFDQVIQGMLRSKPRVLVTHQLQFLEEADEILILKEGACLGKGTFEAMATSGVDFSSLLKRDEEDEEEKKEEEKRMLQRLESIVSEHDMAPSEIGSTFSLASIGTEFKPDAVQLPEKEERKEGTVGWRVYYSYFKAGAGPLLFLFLVLVNLLAQGAYIASDWWLSYWSNQEENRQAQIYLDLQLRMAGHNDTNVTIPEVNTNENIYIFSGIIAAVFLFGIVRALTFFKVMVDASMHLHNRMFERILRAPIAFFDTNPVGRILNRFSKDVGHMDDLLPLTTFDFVQCFLLITGIILVVCVVNPWVFIPIMPLVVLFFLTRAYYLRTSRHVKRLEGTTRSPVFSHLSASLQGLHSIRAFRAQEKFVEEFDDHQDLHSEAWFMFLATSRWLAVRLDWICAIFVAVVAFSCVILSSSMNAGEVGLSLTYAMTLMGMFQWAVRQSAEVENQMISVERVLDYSKLDTEAPLTSDEGGPPPAWPQQGEIITQNACLRYSPTGPWVLNSLNLHIKGREKIGIVGRTGAGKSSLISMLFRMVEPKGSIRIDDVEVTQIGLHELRNKISIIPQDPVLFTGSLRKNLDPFSEQNDELLWKCLEEVQMKQAVTDLPEGLDSQVSEGGVNFSVGQRQLICLARAILRQNKILMIDEATANVDPRTDAMIQLTIREKFLHCTVLTIAHRLHTIMDSDRVLVLDSGSIMEFDPPYLLLQNEAGFLSQLVQQTGKATADQLMEVAKAAYHGRGQGGERTPAGDGKQNHSQGVGDSSHVQDPSFLSDETGYTSTSMNGSSVIGDVATSPVDHMTPQQNHSTAGSLVCPENQSVPAASGTANAAEEDEEEEDEDNESSSLLHHKNSNGNHSGIETKGLNGVATDRMNVNGDDNQEDEEEMETSHLLPDDDDKSNDSSHVVKDGSFGSLPDDVTIETNNSSRSGVDV